MKRPTNQELCSAFRTLLTGKATDAFDHELKQLGPHYGNAEDILRITKPWRGELWKAFREIEERMCPTPEIARRYIKDDR